jgi:hypothetical protein
MTLIVPQIQLTVVSVPCLDWFARYIAEVHGNLSLSQQGCKQDTRIVACEIHVSRVKSFGAPARITFKFPAMVYAFIVATDVINA